MGHHDRAKGMRERPRLGFNVCLNQVGRGTVAFCGVDVAVHACDCMSAV